MPTPDLVQEIWLKPEVLEMVRKGYRYDFGPFIQDTVANFHTTHTDGISWDTAAASSSVPFLYNLESRDTDKAVTSPYPRTPHHPITTACINEMKRTFNVIPPLNEVAAQSQRIVQDMVQGITGCSIIRDVAIEWAGCLFLAGILDIQNSRVIAVQAHDILLNISALSDGIYRDLLKTLRDYADTEFSRFWVG